jgi:hypothetical protein
MRSLIILATGLAVLSLSAPVLTAAQAEETIVIKRHHDRDWHRGWRGEVGERRVIIERHHDRGWHRGWYGDRY